MADPHPPPHHARPPAALELPNVTSYVELLSSLPFPVAPAPAGSVPRPPSAIGDAAAVERLAGDQQALARMRAALAGVKQVPYMCVEWRKGWTGEQREKEKEREREKERRRAAFDRAALCLFPPYLSRALTHSLTHFFLLSLPPQPQPPHNTNNLLLSCPLGVSSLTKDEALLSSDVDPVGPLQRAVASSEAMPDAFAVAFVKGKKKGKSLLLLLSLFSPPRSSALFSSSLSHEPQRC